MTSVNDLKNPEELRKVLKDFANECLKEIYECAFLGGPERRYEIFKKGYELAKKVEDHTNQTLFAGWLVWDNIHMGNLDKALVLAKETVELDRKTGNMEHLPQSIGPLGCVHHVLGNWDKSEEYFKEAFRLYQSQDLKDWILLTNIHDWFGWFYFDTGDYVKAKEHYKKVYEVCEKAGDIRGQINDSEFIIWTCIELGEIEEAMNVFNNMIKLTVEVEKAKIGSYIQSFSVPYQSKKHTAVVDTLRGMLFRAQKKWDKSIKHFEKSLKQHEALTSRKWDAYLFTKMVLIEYARVYMERNQKGDKEKANSLLDEALEIFQRLGAKKEMEKIMAKKKLLAA